MGYPQQHVFPGMVPPWTYYSEGSIIRDVEKGTEMPPLGITAPGLAITSRRLANFTLGGQSTEPEPLSPADFLHVICGQLKAFFLKFCTVLPYWPYVALGARPSRGQCTQNPVLDN